MNRPPLLPYSILLVEDEPLALDQLCFLLERIYVRVDRASDGIMGLDKMEERLPDIVVTDLEMPKMNGLEMIEQIRERHRNLPIIVITAISELQSLIRAIELQVSAYVLKPIAPDLLLEAITKCVLLIEGERSRLKKEQFQLGETILRSKTELLRDVAHHWRNPLSAISIYLQSVLGSLTGNQPLSLAQKQELSERGAGVLQLITRLSENINDFATLFATQQRPALLELGSLLKSMASLCVADQRMDGPCPGGCEVVLPPQPVLVYGIESRLRLVVYQVLVNAAESQQRADTDHLPIVLKLHAENGRVLIVCEDQGEGIRSEIFERICEPYVSSKDRGSGYGLGLFMVRSILESDFNGTLLWENRAEGGARFTLSLPESSEEEH